MDLREAASIIKMVLTEEEEEEEEEDPLKERNAALGDENLDFLVEGIERKRRRKSTCALLVDDFLCCTRGKSRRANAIPFSQALSFLLSICFHVHGRMPLCYNVPVCLVSACDSLSGCHFRDPTYLISSEDIERRWLKRDLQEDSISGQVPLL